MTEPRDIIATVLDYPTAFDTPTFAEWKEQMADAILAALGLEHVGYMYPGGADLVSLTDAAYLGHTDEPKVYRLGHSGRRPE